MKSPFPGMDPYLEDYWGDVQASLAIYARDHLNGKLPGDLRARVESSITITDDEDDDDEENRYRPDVQVVELAKKGGRAGGRRKAPVAAAEPILVARPGEGATERSVHITTKDGNRLVTAIEFLSPSNKIGKRGRDEYAVKQKDILDAGASLVEIDLIRGGEHVSAYGPGRVPQAARTVYKASAVRGWRLRKAEVYPISLREPLPIIGIPLRQTDEDATLDLQALIALAYENGGYDAIDYRGRLAPALDPADAAWVDDLLKRAGKR